MDDNLSLLTINIIINLKWTFQQFFSIGFVILYVTAIYKNLKESKRSIHYTT